MSEVIPHNNEIEIGDYTFIYKEKMTVEEWLDTRRDGIGGSDLGVIMGVNPWMSKTRLWYEKLDMSDPKDLSRNNSIHWGRRLESVILEDSQYFNPADPLEYMTNFESKNKLFSHVDFPFFTIHNDIPWLRMNVDGLGYYDSSLTYDNVKQMVFNGELPNPDKLIEIKTIKKKSADSWVRGYPEGYYYQVLGYMIVFLGMNEDVYAELYSLVDGSDFRHHNVDYLEEDAMEVIEESFKFQQSIEEGRQILKELPYEKALEELMAIEPEPQGIKDYSDFISEFALKKMAAEKNKIRGDDKILNLVEQYIMATEAKKVIEEDVLEYGNLIKDFMRKNDATIIDFGDEGRVTFNRRLYPNLKRAS